MISCSTLLDNQLPPDETDEHWNFGRPKTFFIDLKCPSPRYASLAVPASPARRPLELLPSSEELEEVEGATRKALDAAVKKKQSLLEQLEAAIKRVKDNFMRHLDCASVQLRELIESSSKGAFFEKTAFDFFDRKSDFEKEPRPQTRRSLAKTLRTLFELEERFRFRKLIDADSLSRFLEAFESDFPSSRASFMESQAFCSFKKFIRKETSNRLNLESDLAEAELPFSAGDSLPSPQSLWKASALGQNLRRKFAQKPLKRRPLLLGDAESVSARVVRFLGAPSSRVRFRQATPFNTRPHVFVCGVRDEPNWSNCHYEDKIRYGFDCRVCPQTFQIVDALRPESPLATFEIENNFSGFVVSPSDRFISFRNLRTQVWSVLEVAQDFSSVAPLSLPAIGKRSPSSLAFVDYPGREKVVFVDERQTLTVLDLTSQRVDFSGQLGRPMRVCYLDPGHFALVHSDFSVGIFSLLQMKVLNWLTPNLTLHKHVSLADQISRAFAAPDRRALCSFELVPFHLRFPPKRPYQ